MYILLCLSISFERLYIYLNVHVVGKKLSTVPYNN